VAERLDALNEAYQILDRAAGECSLLVGNLPFKFVRDARQHIAAQADELIRPVFVEVDPQ
jgi:hypothetical protein